MDDLALRAGALVLFLAIFAGGVYAAEQAFHVEGPAGAHGLVLTAAEPSRMVAAGDRVGIPVVVSNRGAEAMHAQLAVAAGQPFTASVVPSTVDLAPGAQRGVFVVLQPAAATEGAWRVLVQAVVDGKPAGSLPLPITIVHPEDVADEGEQVTLDYVGRFPNGTVFDTSLRAVGEGPFAKPEGFRRDYQPLQVLLGPEAGTIQGFWRNLVGLGAGQSKSFTLPPEEAYGGASVSQDVPRTADVPRLSQVFERVQHYPRSILTQYLNATSQVGDTLAIEDPSGNARTYRITALDEVNATIVWDVKEGDPFTIYPLWPGQSYATRVTNTTVQFRTQPTDPQQNLTFYQFWPGMTRIRAMNETTITLEHSPPAGYQFTVRQAQGQFNGTVAEVHQDRIVVERPNDHPLAGQTLVFDVVVREVQPAFRAP